MAKRAKEVEDLILSALQAEAMPASSSERNAMATFTSAKKLPSRASQRSRHAGVSSLLRATIHGTSEAQRFGNVLSRCVERRGSEAKLHHHG
eukprot:CAMPEP_0179181200 /NCGR_PEP_ID=MMETSP0796-20121207/89733_1 /TAXON_ID=73915 /ORGANISM="Pyrodinium bahamense, Strain pbaha01" /LENGTH=91 /DNA_ID=CAMNT_0020884955 /DNA_START=207 /DNA_END=479 /DNA_ORIENTATION=-